MRSSQRARPSETARARRRAMLYGSRGSWDQAGLARLPDVHVEMASAALGAMCMVLIFELDRNGNEASVTDAALGDDTPSEVPDFVHRAPQHRYLHAAVVIEVDVHSRH